jgi:hypothetical protein
LHRPTHELLPLRTDNPRFPLHSSEYPSTPISLLLLFLQNSSQPVRMEGPYAFSQARALARGWSPGTPSAYPYLRIKVTNPVKKHHSLPGMVCSVVTQFVAIPIPFSPIVAKQTQASQSHRSVLTFENFNSIPGWCIRLTSCTHRQSRLDAGRGNTIAVGISAKRDNLISTHACGHQQSDAAA